MNIPPETDSRQVTTSSSLRSAPPVDESGSSSQHVLEFETLSLGEGDEVTMRLSESVNDSLSPQCGVFENSFNRAFTESAYVEVTSDGERSLRLPDVSLG